ncbi:MAG: hypothetical protein F6K19_02985 [Cyanothece sp. SIO1E1]|nr:hypothetical protein [Cyanothece sp. SIO1E1]
MLFYNPALVTKSIAVSLLVLLTACAGGSIGENLEQSLQADPQLAENGRSASLPGANAAEENSELERPEPGADAIRAATNRDSVINSPVLQPNSTDFVGPVLPTDLAAQKKAEVSPEDSDTSSPQIFSDLDQTPEALRPYVEDMAALGILKLTADDDAQSQAFVPNQTITRREYARWLLAANNLLHGDRPTQRIRLAVKTAKPVFQDISNQDADFPAIQGLAEAGIIPSPLSGGSTTVVFRPNDPLTRADLMLWKVPLDLRQGLPSANLDALQQTWGFQDAAKIDPKVQRAVLADFQNGDLANIRRVFGYTTLFQPKKTVTRAEAAASLWYFGAQDTGLSAKDVLERSGES